MHYTFSLMDQTAAEALVTWRYEGIYAMYNMGGDDTDNSETIAELLDHRSPYYSIHTQQGELIGFCNIGTSALVWGNTQPSIYIADQTTAIGLGMRPDLTGNGLGQSFVQACIDFTQRTFAPKHIHLYVLSWNQRAIRVYEHAGFQPIRTFLQHNIHGANEFVEMSKTT